MLFIPQKTPYVKHLLANRDTEVEYMTCIPPMGLKNFSKAATKHIKLCYRGGFGPRLGGLGEGRGLPPLIILSDVWKFGRSPANFNPSNSMFF